VTDAMTTLIQICDFCVRTLDYPLGWLLSLPRDLALLVFATGTALLMTFARRAVTNQDLLQRGATDLRRLNELMREARHSGDRSQLNRLRGTVGLVKGMQLAADFKVLVVVLLPIAILAIWAAERFDNFPPRPNEELIIRAHFPLSSVDRLAHLVPSQQFQLKSAAIQIVRASSSSPPTGIAEWTLQPTVATDDLTITIRHQNESAEHHVAVGRTTSLAPVQSHDNNRLLMTEVVLKRYHPLGLDLGSETIGLPPWMMAYLLLTLVLTPILKRMLRVS
jgi:membrane protein implicated in regulation of membrane protease activity